MKPTTYKTSVLVIRMLFLPLIKRYKKQKKVWGYMFFLATAGTWGFFVIRMLIVGKVNAGTCRDMPGRCRDMPGRCRDMKKSFPNHQKKGHVPAYRHFGGNEGFPEIQSIHCNTEERKRGSTMAATLCSIYEQMEREADKKGQATAMLRGGVRVKRTISTISDGDETVFLNTCAIWRRHKKLGDTEIITFRKHFAIPDGARRLPNKGQKEHWETVELEAADGEMEQGRVKWYGIAWKWQTCPEGQKQTLHEYTIGDRL